MVALNLKMDSKILHIVNEYDVQVLEVLLKVLSLVILNKVSVVIGSITKYVAPRRIR